MTIKQLAQEYIDNGCKVVITIPEQQDLVHSVEIGPANCRFKIYFKTFEELSEKLTAAQVAMAMGEELGLVKGGKS